MKKVFRVGIFSGKGGVGKTTICASIAVLLSRSGIKILTADTDVDAPNLSILFSSNPVSSPSPNHSQKEILVQTTEKARLKEELCIRCRRCVSEKFCNFDALSWDSVKSFPIIDPIACEGCHACRLLCSQHAFEMFPVNSGKIAGIQSEFGFYVITGETILGAQTSGKLVTELKKYTDKFIENQEIQAILYDGPPGIGCPVIAAASGLDYIIIILEPTKVALHDAKRFIMIPEKFKIPYGLILNKANLTDKYAKYIRDYIQKNNLELLGEIPLDRDWPFSVAKRLPFVFYRPTSLATECLQKITDKLITKIEKFHSS